MQFLAILIYLSVGGAQSADSSFHIFEAPGDGVVMVECEAARRALLDFAESKKGSFFPNNANNYTEETLQCIKVNP